MKRAIYFTYGAVAYAVFFGSLLYLIGFVTGFVVPKWINSGPESPLATAILINLGLVALFGVQHSVMARPTFKRWFTRFVPKEIERSSYVLIGSLILFLTYWQWRPIDIVIWNVTNESARTALYAACLGGFGLVVITTFLINHFDLFGLRQVWLQLRKKAYTAIGFKTPGPYKHVRHPLYVGWLSAFWFTPHMTVGHLLFAVANTAYILIAIYYEERNLVDQHGQQYVQYRQRTPKLIPQLKPVSLDPAPAIAPSDQQAG
jgi:protein-S-isoprenylcysteine O-methyltransferase Ste14